MLDALDPLEPPRGLAPELEGRKQPGRAPEKGHGGGPVFAFLCPSPRSKQESGRAI